MTRFDANYTTNNSETGETIYTPYTYQAVVPRPFPDNATIPLLDLQRRAEDPNDNATMDDVRTRRIYNGTFFHFLFYAQVSMAICHSKYQYNIARRAMVTTYYFLLYTQRVDGVAPRGGPAASTLNFTVSIGGEGFNGMRDEGRNARCRFGTLEVPTYYPLTTRLLLTYYSQLAAHQFPPTTYYAPLTTSHSLLTTH